MNKFTNLLGCLCLLISLILFFQSEELTAKIEPKQNQILTFKSFTSTFFGGDTTDYFQDTQMDIFGNTYICGSTFEPDLSDFPQTISYPEKFYNQRKGNDCFLTKFDPEGKFIYSIVFGGRNNDKVNTMTINDSGYVFVGGYTKSGNFPALGSNFFKPEQTDIDLIGGAGFITKFSPEGKLIFSLIFCGDTSTAINGAVSQMDLDGNDNLYINGVGTYMAKEKDGLFPLFYYGAKDYASLNFGKLNTKNLMFEYFFKMGFQGSFKTDKAGKIYIAGTTVDGGDTVIKELWRSAKSSYFPVFGGSSDIFLLCLNPDLRTVEYANFIGGNDRDEMTGFDVDDVGNVFISGAFSPPQLHTTIFKGDTTLKDNFTDICFFSVIKFNSKGGLAYSDGFLDKTRSETIKQRTGYPVVVTDNTGKAYLIAHAGSGRKNLPLKNSFQSSFDQSPGYLAEINKDGTKLDFATYFIDGLSRVQNKSNTKIHLSVPSEGGLVTVGGFCIYDEYDLCKFTVQDSSLIKQRNSRDDIWLAFLNESCDLSVTNTDDDGPGSLRAAIECFNNNPRNKKIKFDLNPTDKNFIDGVYSIYLKTGLPPIIHNGLFIDGISQTQKENTNPDGPEIQIYGGSLKGRSNGFTINSSNCEVSGISINGFDRDELSSGIYIGNKSKNNRINSCFIGISPSGERITPNSIGILAEDNTSENIFSYCVISGNRKFGIYLNNSTKNIIQGNFIGTNKDGTKPAVEPLILNRQIGIFATNSSDNTIGDLLGLTFNLISGNETGIFLAQNSNNNKIEYSLIGTDYQGRDVIRNNIGIIIDSSSLNTIGTDLKDKKCVISGNFKANILIQNPYSVDNVIRNCLIGTDAEGKYDIEPNNGTEEFPREIGILIQNCMKVHIIPSRGGYQNVISGNRVGILAFRSSIIKISGNIIGADINGTKAVPNSDEGIWLLNSSDCEITKDPLSSDLPNIISGNMASGIKISGYITFNGVDTTYFGANNLITGNFIGTDITGTNPLPNKGNGISIINGSKNTIGGEGDNKNIISSNGYLQGLTAGVFLSGPLCLWNQIVGNYIGLDKTGIKPLGNSTGIKLANGASKNTIGSTKEPNYICDNQHSGIFTDGNIEFERVKKDEILDFSKKAAVIYNFPKENLYFNNFIGLNINNDKVGFQRKGVFLIKSISSIVGVHPREYSNRIYNSEIGIELLESQNNVIFNNELINDSIGINLSNSHRNKIQQNLISRCGTGILLHDTLKRYNLICNNNIISGKGNTGLHFINSDAEVKGNVIINDETDGIVTESSANPVIYHNFFRGNKISGVTNKDDNVNIKASNNWWGSSDGPSGTGNGTGDAVFGNVEYEPWLINKNTSVISLSHDTLIIPAGMTLSLFGSIRSFNDSDTTFDITFAASNDWVKLKSPLHLESKDSSGAFFVIDVQVPDNLKQEEMKTLIVESVSENNSRDTDTCYILGYNPELTNLYVIPDTVIVISGETSFFYTISFDQYNNLQLAHIDWTAEKGVIDETGKYTAPDEEGIFRITGKDINSEKKDYGYVKVIKSTTSVPEERYNKLPETKADITIIPNPSSDKISIKFNPQLMQLDESGFEIEIYNVIGERILNLPIFRNISGYEVEVSDLQQGLFYIVISKDNHRITRQFAVIR